MSFEPFFVSFGLKKSLALQRLQLLSDRISGAGGILPQRTRRLGARLGCEMCQVQGLT